MKNYTNINYKVYRGSDNTPTNHTCAIRMDWVNTDKLHSLCKPYSLEHSVFYLCSCQAKNYKRLMLHSSKHTSLRNKIDKCIPNRLSTKRCSITLIGGFGFMVHSATFNNISVIVAVSFIGGRKRRKPTTCRKSLTNLSHNVVLSTPRHEWCSNAQL